jgi:hypothetical protein
MASFIGHVPRHRAADAGSVLAPRSDSPAVTQAPMLHAAAGSIARLSRSPHIRKWLANLQIGLVGACLQLNVRRVCVRFTPDGFNMLRPRSGVRSRSLHACQTIHAERDSIGYTIRLVTV